MHDNPLIGQPTIRCVARQAPQRSPAIAVEIAPEFFLAPFEDAVRPLSATSLAGARPFGIQGNVATGHTEGGGGGAFYASTSGDQH